MDFKRIVIPVIVVLLIGSALIYSNSSTTKKSDIPFETRFGPIMGTEGYVKILPSENVKISAEDAFNKAYQVTKKAESKLSRFIVSSDISKLNNSPADKKIQISPVTWQALMESRRFYQLSEGFFDPSVGALVNIYPWGAHEIKSLPSHTEIDQALSKSGFNHLTFQREGMFVSKDIPGLVIDLGGIAKGLGVDIMANALKSQGVSDAIIEIGGEITIIGSTGIEEKSSQLLGSGKKVWTTGIKDPRGNGIIKKFSASGGVSIATSGDYEKFFFVDGKRFSHILNPRTGYPTTSKIISATVITKRPCVIADALATTISVVGIEKSKELLELFPDTEAFLIMNDKKQLSISGGVKDLDLPEITEN